MRKFRAARVACGAVVVAAVAGCGAGGGSADELTPAAAMERAAAAVADVESGKFSVEVAGRQGGSAAEPVKVRASGAFSASPEPAMSLAFDELDLGGADGLDVDGLQEIVFADKGLFLRGSMLGMDAGKWMKLPFGDLMGDTGDDMFGALLSGGSDPREQLEMLLGAGEVRKVGVETVDGTQTTHYAGELTRDELVAAADVSDAIRESMKSSLDDGGIGAIDLDLWVDEDYLARKFAVRVPGKNGDELRFTLSFSDLGAPVSITAPPAADVMDTSAMFGGLLQGLTGALENADGNPGAGLEELFEGLDVPGLEDMLKSTDLEKAMKGLDLEKLMKEVNLTEPALPV
jgi:hypothetical protein